MRRIIFITALFTFYLNNAQIKEATETELNEKAESEMIKYQEKFFEADSPKLREKAYQSYSLLVSKFPKSEKHTIYLYYKGCLSTNNEESKNCFKDVIKANDWKYYIRQCYIHLSFQAVEDNDFKLLKEYLDAIEKMEAPTFTCGNEMETYKAQLKNLHASYETGIKK
jgi:hypothetical protein